MTPIEAFCVGFLSGACFLVITALLAAKNVPGPK